MTIKTTARAQTTGTQTPSSFDLYVREGPKKKRKKKVCKSGF